MYFACRLMSCVIDGHRLIISDLSGNACNRLSKKLRTCVVSALHGDSVAAISVGDWGDERRFLSSKRRVLVHSGCTNSTSLVCASNHRLFSEFFSGT